MRAFGFGPSLALRQGAWGAAFDFTGGSLPAGAALTRASAGSCWNASGVLVSVAADAARFDHDPDTLSLRGLLIEPARSNLLLRSRALDTAPWAGAGTGSVTGGQASPGGSEGFAVADGDAAGVYTLTQMVGVTSGDTVSVSAFVKKDAIGKATRAAVLRLSNPKLLLVLDTATGELALGTGSLGTPGAMSAVSRGNFWHVRVTYVATAASAGLIVFPAYAQGSLLAELTATVALTGSIVLADPQIELGGAVTSPIVSGASAGSRAADLLTLDWGSRSVADGTRMLRFTFDDGSSQDVATAIAGGVASVPTNLNRRHIRRAEAV